jgi:hypothetical protein
MSFSISPLRRLVENVSGGAGLAPSLPSGTFSWFVFYSLALFSPVVVQSDAPFFIFFQVFIFFLVFRSFEFFDNICCQA